jgi:hypothetical protein
LPLWMWLGHPCANVSDVVGKSLGNLLKEVKVYWKPYPKFVIGHERILGTLWQNP